MKKFLIYCLSLVLFSLSGQQTTQVLKVWHNKTSQAVFVEREIPKTLNPYLWIDASKPEYFSDRSDNPIVCNSSEEKHHIKSWKDRSGNERYFVAQTLPSIKKSNLQDRDFPEYTCYLNSFPYYSSRNFLEGKGLFNEMLFDFKTAPSGLLDRLSGELSGDFTFVAVIQAEDLRFSKNEALLSSGNDASLSGNWQLSVGIEDVSKFYFRLSNFVDTKKSITNNEIPLNKFDNQKHIYLVKRSGGTLTVKVDGVEYFSDTLTDVSVMPVFRELRLFTDRAADIHDREHSDARFFELIVFPKALNAEQDHEVNEYLKAKWIPF